MLSEVIVSFEQMIMVCNSPGPDCQTLFTLCLHDYVRVWPTLSLNLNDKETLAYICKHIFEPPHEISNIVVWATTNASDQPAHTRSLIRALACRLNIV